MRHVVATPPATSPVRRPRHRPRAGRVLLLLVALVALAGAALAVISLIPRPAPSGQDAAPVSLPDTLLVTRYDQGTMSLWAYLPGGSAFQPVLDGAGQPVVAPDGRQLLASRATRDGEAARVTVVAVDAGSLARQWETTVASFPASALPQDSLTSAGAGLAVTADRVYAGPSVWGAASPLNVVVLDRATGRELARWSIDVGDKAVAGIRFFASPDGASLYLLTSTRNLTTHQTTAEVYLRLRTTDGAVVDRHDLVGPDGKPFYPGDRMAPDGRILYGVGSAPSPSGALSIQFFDLGSGAVLPSLTLPLQSDGDVLDREEATSPDGRTLYVLAPTSGELAIVDVQTRVVLQVVPVEGLAAAGPSLLARVLAALRGLVVQDAAAKFSFTGDMQLSPDGKRLYAVGVNGSRYEGVPTGVVGIDTATWRVTDRWLPDAQVAYLQLGADGHTLYVQTVQPSNASGSMALVALDTRTGVASPPTADDLPGYAYSLDQLYRQRYGRAPDAAGIAAAPAAPVVPLARLDVSVDRTSIPAGDRVTVDARFVDPATGRPVTPGQSGVRYQPPQRVTATFYHGQIGSGDVVVELAPAGYGHYRGSAVLTDPTAWSLQVDAWRADAPGSRASIASAVAVEAAFVGTDGRRYMLKLSTDPAAPVPGQPATVRAAFVDAERGTALPDGVELSGGTPASIDAGFFLGSGDLGQAREVISVTLRPAGHGAFTAAVRLDKVGGWTALVDFAQGERALQALAGTVQVAGP